MDVHASLKSLRMSPRKVRLVIDAVRGLSVAAAELRLTFMPKGAALPVLKLIRSAVANAEHNFHLSKDGLKVARITADGGPTLKRMRPRAFGRSAPIRKRTTHIMLTLSTNEAMKTVKPQAEAPVATEPKESKPKTARKTTKKSASTQNA